MTQRQEDVSAAARRLARDLTVDDERDLVLWHDADGTPRQTGFHDYAALYAVPGLYEAAYFEHLGGASPALLADLVADVVPATERSSCSVLDVGVGTGVVGELLAPLGFRRLAGMDIEPASEVAVRRDRGDLYEDVRTMDLLALTGADRDWLAARAPRLVTVAGAVGFGHLPEDAFAVLTDLLPPGGLLALTAARDLPHEPELAGHARLLLGPAYAVRAQRDGLHRRTGDGRALEVTGLVLERT